MNLGPLVFSLFRSLILTVIIEWMVAWYHDFHGWRDFRILFRINLITNPLANLLINLVVLAADVYAPALRTAAMWIAMVLVEAVVFLSEARMLANWFPEKWQGEPEILGKKISGAQKEKRELRTATKVLTPGWLSIYMNGTSAAAGVVIMILMQLLV